MNDQYYVQYAAGFIATCMPAGMAFSANEIRTRGLANPASGNRRLLGNALQVLEKAGIICKIPRKVTSHNGHGQTITQWMRVA